MSKDEFLEKRLAIVERRLSLVEEFLEKRFQDSSVGEVSSEKKKRRKHSDSEDEDEVTIREYLRWRKNIRPSKPSSSSPVSKVRKGDGEDRGKRVSFAIAESPVIRKQLNKPGPASVKFRIAEARKEGRKDKNYGYDLKHCRVQLERRDELEVQAGEKPTMNLRSQSKKPDDAESDTGNELDNQDEPVEPDVEEPAGDEIADDNDEYFTFEGNKSDDEAEPNDDVGGGNESDDVSWKGDDAAGGASDSEDDESGKKVAWKGKPTSKRLPYKPYKYRANCDRPNTYANIEKTLPPDAIADLDPSLQECPICRKHFKTEMMEAHLKIHMIVRHLKCPDCDKTYFTTRALYSHQRSHRPDIYEKKCRLCDKTFLQSSKLLYHERICVRNALRRNEEVDPALIKELRKRSTRPFLAEPAKPLGDPTKRRQCPHCKKWFQAQYYDRHVKTHSMPKLWKCNYCDKAYLKKQSLIRHVGINHAKEHKCVPCELTFDSRDDLLLHSYKCRHVQSRKKREAKAKKANEENEEVHDVADENQEESQSDKGIKEEDSEGEAEQSDRESASSSSVSNHDSNVSTPVPGNEGRPKRTKYFVTIEDTE